MSALTVPFFKMNGIGNKIIVADVRGRDAKVTSGAAVALASREETSFDQIMELHKSAEKDVDADIRILNSDGSEAGACGNGTRCVVALLNREGAKSSYLFRTGGGLVKADYVSDLEISVDIGSPRFSWEDIPLEEEFADTTGIELQIGPIDNPVLDTPSVVNVGNPHAVFWVTDDVESYDLARFGPLLENHPIFPDRANISVARVTSPDRIEVRTWERGAGLTKACGSAACAALVCAARKGLSDRRATIVLPGGELQVEWTQQNRILMSGPAEFEASGMLDPESGEFQFDSSLAGVAS